MNIQGLTPTILSPMNASSASQIRAAASLNSSTAANSSNSPSELQNTFLNLLVTEMQNQDPTSPVDPTQMVSQMVSLNQLEQLVSINQTLQNMSSGSSATAGSVQAQAQSTRVVPPTSGMKGAPVAVVPGAPIYQPPTSLNAMPASTRLMNLYATPGSLPATIYTTQTGAR